MILPYYAHYFLSLATSGLVVDADVSHVVVVVVVVAHCIRTPADGCEQKLHCDNVHGPWAFVLSLTDWTARSFSGGETMLLTDAALSYWSNFEAGRVIESRDLMQLVEPQFNQLTVFDPRIPHGVRQVCGTTNPLEARVVLHGWFVEPGAFSQPVPVQHCASLMLDNPARCCVAALNIEPR